MAGVLYGFANSGFMDYGRLSIRTARGDTDSILLSRVNNGIGSDPANQVVLNGRGIAVFHCKLIADERGAELIDLGSSRGTLVNGNRVSLRRLSDGDKISVGDFTLVYVAPIPGVASERARQAEPIPTELPSSPLPKPPSSLFSSTPPESAIRLLRGSSGPIMPRSPQSDSMLRMPIPPTTQPTAPSNESSEVPVAWAADDIVDERQRTRTNTTSGGLSVDVDRVVHLTIFEGAAPRRMAIDTREVTRIGTHMSCQCMLPYNRQVFPQHASLSMDKGQWMLRKLLPTARLRVNGRDVESSELQGGEVIHVGDIRVQFKDPTQGEMSLQRRCGLGRQIPLSAPSLEVGRDAEPFCLPHPQVGRHQARLENQTQGWTIRNQTALPGVWVNRELLPSTTLTSGDIVAVGPYHYRFHGNALEPLVTPGSVCLTAIEARAEGAEGKGLSLCVYPTELVALVHPTDGSANRMLHVLCGLAPLTSGYVSFNSLRIASGSGVPYGMAYVRADDPLPADGTVDSYVHRTATLSTALDYPPLDLETVIDNALAAMDLAPLVTHRLATLNAAERQRVRIAAALTAVPLVVALEDPCRGLDPMAASHLIERLRDLADRGTPVVFTANPARKLLWCDQVVMLAAETQTGFVGPPHAALRYFSSEAFLDAVLRLSQEKTPGSWSDEFRRSPAFSAFVEPRTNAVDNLVGDAVTARYRWEPWRMLPGRRFQSELQRTWQSLLESRSWVALALLEAVLGGGLLSLFGPQVPYGLTAPVSGFWMVVLAGLWTWGYREGLRWPSATEGQQLERIAALIGQTSLSALLLTLQTAVVVGLLHLRLAFTPPGGVLIVLTLVLVALCGFGAGVVAKRWLHQAPAILSAAMWLLAGMCIFSGSADDHSLNPGILNPLHAALVLLASGFSASPRGVELFWLLPAVLMALGAATAARLLEIPEVLKTGARI